MNEDKDLLNDRQTESIRIKAVSGAVLLLLIVVLCSMTVFAASQPLNTVSIVVNSKLKAGLHLPAQISLGGSVTEGQISVRAGSGDYKVTKAEWTSAVGADVKCGDAPQMKIVLEPTSVQKKYFLSSYRASNVKITDGTFVSASRDGDKLVVTLKVKNVHGRYDAPTDIFWNDNKIGEARWYRPDNTSGYYDLRLKRDGKIVTTLNGITAISYDLYPWMTEAGGYTAEIRTIAQTEEQKKYAAASEWVGSAYLIITDRDVSDGKGKKDGTSAGGGQAKPLYVYGWYKDNGKWRYRFLDGRLVQGGWQNIDRDWYYFDNEGIMQTGWQVISGRLYFFASSGRMCTGWMRSGKNWYYLIPETELCQGEVAGQAVCGTRRFIQDHYYMFNQDGTLYTGWFTDGVNYYYFNELDNSLMGAMLTGWITRDQETYYLDPNGVMAQGWREIDGVMYYFYPGSGQMARNTTVEGHYIDNDGLSW